MCGFRGVVGRGWALLIHPSHLRRAAVRRSRDFEGLRRLALHLNLVESRTCVLGRRPLDAVVVFPFTNAFRRSAARSLLPVTCSGVSCKLRV